MVAPVVYLAILRAICGLSAFAACKQIILAHVTVTTGFY
jgi:hypothetical protein